MTGAPHGDSPARQLLANLSAASNVTAGDAARICLVFAHPDDETLACGAQMPRLRGATLVTVTDGAPRNRRDVAAHGFASAQDYAAARQRELAAALRCAGWPMDAALCLDIGDQEVAHSLTRVATMLADLFARRGTRVAITHAYEGGHPDHDGTAFAVHLAARLSGQERDVAIFEAPFYRLAEAGWARQSFAEAPGSPETVIRLAPEQQELKRRMLDAHRTQREMLATFSLAAERFRLAPSYDFSALPNGGRVLYDQYDWGLTSSAWPALVRTSLAEMQAAA